MIVCIHRLSVSLVVCIDWFLDARPTRILKMLSVTLPIKFPSLIGVSLDRLFLPESVLTLSF